MLSKQLLSEQSSSICTMKDNLNSVEADGQNEYSQE